MRRTDVNRTPAAADRKWMSLALRLAKRGEGTTRPNPPVGAVIVRGSRVVGRGWHALAGGPHAEVAALRGAGRLARGATLYVTLEPCCTFGRTLPCTDAILASGIARVVVAAEDPNPRHCGRGIRLLRKKGIPVTTGVCREQALVLIAPFAKWIRTGLPFVTVKLAMTLDGKIADSGGRSRWISGSESRGIVQRLRGRSDAIVVGAETAIRDNPSLTCRSVRDRAPYRVIADSRCRTPPASRVFRQGRGGAAIVATTALAPAARRRALASAGAGVLVLPRCAGHVSLRALLRRMGNMGLLRVLCEGGGRLAAAFIDADLADEVILFVAPSIMGESAGVPALPTRPRPLAAMKGFRIEEFAASGGDLLVRMAPARGRGTRRCSRD
jgi:diaminohydroxyphosphoribosylaminopyrimidine deaminase/5-amino-6-(5-phosphoribosylamino)uracil reductase